MRITCLMPTFGRRQSILNNAIACFESQSHRRKSLLIFDDLGTLGNTTCSVDGVHIISSPVRAKSIGGKYNAIIAYMDALEVECDAVAVWDDDDIYLPGHLATHAKVLEDSKWSKPSGIVSAYFDPPAIENAQGRFHGSIAVRKDSLDDLIRTTGSAWIDTTRATFDQEMLAKLQAESPPGDPCKIAPPQYVYRWQTSKAGHCSGLMGSQNWYAEYRPDSRQPIDRLWPEFDADTVRINSLSQADGGFKPRAI